MLESPLRPPLPAFAALLRGHVSACHVAIFEGGFLGGADLQARSSFFQFRSNSVLHTPPLATTIVFICGSCTEGPLPTSWTTCRSRHISLAGSSCRCCGASRGTLPASLSWTSCTPPDPGLTCTSLLRYDGPGWSQKSSADV